MSDNFNVTKLCNENCGTGYAHLVGGCVNNSHYIGSDIQPIEYMADQLSCEEYKGFLKGSIIKYVSRATKKGAEKGDYKKLAWYANKLAEL